MSGGGLFDRTVVPRGTRFTFEIAHWSSSGNEELLSAGSEEWERLRAALTDSRLRFGAQTRAGLGAVEVVRFREWIFDIAKPEDVSRLALLSTDLQRFAAEGTERPLRQTGPAPRVYRVRPSDFWRVGGVENAVASPTDPDRGDADMAPFVEEVVEWRQTGRIEARYLLIPGSSLKGALRHRTAFHLARLSGRLLDAEVGEPSESLDDESVLAEMFGSVKTGGGGQRGRVLIDDVVVPWMDAHPRLATITHNSIDRFSGGVRSGFLFSEQMVWKGDFEIRVTLLSGSQAGTSSIADTALDLAITDLLEGRLAIGAASGRGHGRLTGEIVQ